MQSWALWRVIERKLVVALRPSLFNCRCKTDKPTIRRRSSWVWSSTWALTAFINYLFNSTNSLVLLAILQFVWTLNLSIFLPLPWFELWEIIGLSCRNFALPLLFIWHVIISLFLPNLPPDWFWPFPCFAFSSLPLPSLPFPSFPVPYTCLCLCHFQLFVSRAYIAIYR